MKTGMMNYYEGEFYRVYDFSKNMSLNLNPSEEKSVEGCRKAIDRYNEWAKSAEGRKYGNKPERYLIVKHIWNRCFYPDGTFYEENEKTRTVEVYPAEI